MKKPRSRMDDGALEVMVKNEIEWRKMLWKKVDAVEDDQDKIFEEMSLMKQDLTGMKVKVAFFGATFGFIAGLIIELFKFKSK